MTDNALQIPPAAASHFANNKQHFESLFDALATGNVSGAMKIATDGGIPHKDASLMVRDSSALAAAMNSIGDMMTW